MTYPDSNDYLSNVTDDYRPPHVRHADRVVEMMRNEPLSVRHKVPMDIAEPPRLDLLSEMASIARRLTWAQMMEYAEGTKGDPEEISRWANTMP